MECMTVYKVDLERKHVRFQSPTNQLDVSKDKQKQDPAMSTVRWAESRQGRKLVTTTQQINLKNQTHGGPGGLVSYEDLLIAQYLDELRNSKKTRQTREESPKPSPYTQKLPHSDYTYKYRTRRPVSASNATSSGKPKIDAKFIADPSLWDPATPRNNNEEGPEMYQVIVTEKSLKSRQRPASAPVKRNKLNRPTSAASTLSYYGRSRPFSGRSSTYYGGRKIKSQYKKQPHTIRVTAFRNGTREPFIRLAAPSMKMLLEFCTDKLNLPFAARRVFLEDGIEVFTEKDIPIDSEVYISTGENYKDPYATTKRNIILHNGAKWTLTGVMLPEEGKKKISKPRLSKRMKKLAEVKRVRIIVYRNGKCTEPVEVVADLSKLEEFLVACTAKLDLRSHARILYDWEGNEITSLAETPILDDCLQSGGTYVLGPVWVSTGEGFSPSGTRDFLITIREVIKNMQNIILFSGEGTDAARRLYGNRAISMQLPCSLRKLPTEIVRRERRYEDDAADMKNNENLLEMANVYNHLKNVLLMSGLLHGNGVATVGLPRDDCSLSV
ncbi:uncharacterized protein LOC128549935 [Mercenaria mercenaria]|uniref:uncharacterized protein LOC128549935 n=1 Tax=Mercenaria mercenaria TaxID=6596 RepID=UPI00234E9BF9|nr:uncharacterized protein LOC128549935 [Mercenaria mercenaria]